MPLTAQPTHRRALRGIKTSGAAATLMEFSERRLERAANSDLIREAAPAMRLLQDLTLFRSWEHTHRRLMQDIAEARLREERRTRTRKAAFLTVHRKAPFEYLRDRQITGPIRRRLVRALFAGQDYAQCIVRENVAYLSASCSLMCIDSLCCEVFSDEAFSDSLTRYEEAYTEYYRAYCDCTLADMSGKPAPLKSLLPYLRYQLKMVREHILEGASPGSAFSQVQALYAQSGDTQVLPVIR